MKYLVGMSLVIVLSFLISSWLETTLPHYAYAMGTGMAFSFIIGVFTDINN